MKLVVKQNVTIKKRANRSLDSEKLLYEFEENHWLLRILKRAAATFQKWRQNFFSLTVLFSVKHTKKNFAKSSSNSIINCKYNKLPFLWSPTVNYIVIVNNQDNLSLCIQTAIIGLALRQRNHFIIMLDSCRNSPLGNEFNFVP